MSSHTFEELESNTHLALGHTIKVRRSMDTWSLMKELYLAIRKFKAVTAELRAAELRAAAAKQSAEIRAVAAKQIEARQHARLLFHFEELSREVHQTLDERKNLRNSFVHGRCYSELESSTQAFLKILEHYRRSIVEDESQTIEEQLATYIRNNAGTENDLDLAFETAGVESWLRNDPS